VTGQLGDIRRLLKVDVQKARAELEKHVGEIRMMPQTDGKKATYVAEGNGTCWAGMAKTPVHPPTKRIRMVAGEGFEPSTFGL
jgi:hypothetical protein